MLRRPPPTEAPRWSAWWSLSGGNALLRRGAEDTFEELYRAARDAAEHIADIAAAGWEVVVTHGNGPQVGRILLQQEAAAEVVHPMPLDVCGAESQGQIGYLLQVTIGDVFFERGMERPVATVLTLTRVRPDDPAFDEPHEVRRPLLRRGRGAGGWRPIAATRCGPTRTAGWRRVVASPKPYSIVETPIVQSAGGRRRRRHRGRGRRRAGRRGRAPADRKEGVVDKDLAAAILAHEVEASTLLILTDVTKVQRGYGSLLPEDIDRLTVKEAAGRC